MSKYTLSALGAVALVLGVVIWACVALLPTHANQSRNASPDNPPAAVVAHHNTQHSIGPCGPSPCRKGHFNGQ